MLVFVMVIGVAAAQVDQLDSVHVVNRPGSLYDFIPSTTTLNNEKLQRKRETSLGDTLQREAGINSGSFGPGAGRPVIRGLEGDRIRVLQNGLGTMDASAQSVDHGVPVDMLNTEQVDVVRGPMSLLYGASAVGGVVNVVNQRIHRQFDAGAISQFDLLSDSAYGGGAGSARLDWGKQQWMTHIDGSWREAGDQRVSGGERLANTQVHQEGVALGVSRVFSRGYLGASFAHFGSQYGSVAEPEVEIFLRQNRWELAGEYRPEESSWFDRLRVRSAQSDYQHDEREGGAVGTVFTNQGNESRLEFMRSRGPWSHVAGVQTQLFEFAADGAEAYLPTAQNRIVALFSFHERTLDELTVNFGGRVENANVEREEAAQFGDATTRDFTGVSASAGVQRRWGSVTLGLTGSYTERAPTFQELFSNGGHVATGTFEVGDHSLKKEKGHSLEATLRHATGRTGTRLSAYLQEFADYVALIPQGTVDADSGFPIQHYQAVDARFYGMDAESAYRLSGNWSLKAKGDWVRGKNLDSGDDLPRLSPPRLGAGVEWEKGEWSWDTELMHAFEQQNLANNESATAGYDMWDMGVQRAFTGQASRLALYLRLKNLFDEKARNHVSTVKDIAPLPGRNVVVGMNVAW